MKQLCDSEKTKQLVFTSLSLKTSLGKSSHFSRRKVETDFCYEWNDDK